MANAVWHNGYGITVHLTQEGLGHPDRPGLLDEICTSVTERDPGLLECLAHHDGHECGSHAEGKSPWMFISRRRINGNVVLVASHLPITHRATAAESDRHKATKERIASAADRNGLSVELEARAEDGKSISDALVTGPDGTRIGWEVQYHALSPGSVRRRTERIRERGVTPAWITDDLTASLIDRAPWSRVDDMSWKDIANGRELVIRGGLRRLQVWRCTAGSDFECLSGSGHCLGTHTDWLLPVLCVPRQPLVTIDELVVASACGEYTPIFVPRRSDPRTRRHMWVPAVERNAWAEINDASPAPNEPERYQDDELTWTNEPPDRHCSWGENGFIPTVDRRPIRDSGDSDARRAPRVPATDAAPGLRLSDPERRAAARAFRCAPWEIGPCTGCGGLMPRYRPNAGMYCHGCRGTAPPAR